MLQCFSFRINYLRCPEILFSLLLSLEKKKGKEAINCHNNCYDNSDIQLSNHIYAGLINNIFQERLLNVDELDNV